MSNLRFLFLAFLLTVTLAISALAENGTRTAAYVAPATLPPQLLVPPPDEGSESWRQEIDGVLKAQKNVSATDLAAMRNEQHVTVALIAKTIGDDFAPQRFPKTFALLGHVLEDAGRVSYADKKFWHTRRPYLTDHRVTLLVDPVDDNPAYPSGHATATRVLAEVLGLLYPERLEALRARAFEIAQHRIEAGVHYPVDIRGGETLAYAHHGRTDGEQRFPE